MTFEEQMPTAARLFLSHNEFDCDFDRVVYADRRPIDAGDFSGEYQEPIDAIIKCFADKPPRCAVELGCFLGKSSLWLAERFEYVLCVDGWLGSDEQQAELDRRLIADLYPQFLANVAAANRFNIVPIRMTTGEAFELIDWPCAVDLVWINARQEIGGVWDNAFWYSSILSERGSVCGSDFDIPEVRSSVESVADSLAMKLSSIGPFWRLDPDESRRQSLVKAVSTGI